VIASHGGATVKSPKTRASIRRVAVDNGTLKQLKVLRVEQQRLDDNADVQLSKAAFVSADPGGDTPPYPDTISRAFSKARVAAGLPADPHLHSLCHFQANSLDAVTLERQKHARLGWSTAHMAGHLAEIPPAFAVPSSGSGTAGPQAVAD